MFKKILSKFSRKKPPVVSYRSNPHSGYSGAHSRTRESSSVHDDSASVALSAAMWDSGSYRSDATNDSSDRSSYSTYSSSSPSTSDSSSSSDGGGGGGGD